MECRHCGTTNRDGAAFCRHCGRLLRDKCPRCRAFADAAANFCDACGYPLSPQAWTGSWPRPETKTTQPAPSPQPEPSRIVNDPAENEFNLERFIPQALAEKLQSSRESGISGERRIVTILFCDIKGSTALAEQLDPEEWSEIVNGAFEQMVPPIYKYEGTVARLTGDGLLAFFGAPIAHEDDPSRAVLAGLEIVGGIHTYREGLPAMARTLDVRIGINTGLVVVGAVGSDMRLEYSALGDTINLAARMEQTADPGTVQIADDTFRLLAGQFVVEPLGGIDVKGKSEPVSAYRVLRRRSASEMRQFQMSFHTPLINRTREWAIMEEAFERLAGDRGGIVFLTGDAGMGKSRLIFESISRLYPQLKKESQFKEEAAFAYETSLPYGLITRLLRQLLELGLGAGPETIRERMRTAGFNEAEEKQATRVLESLFGITGGNQPVRLSGEEFVRQLLTCMEHILSMKAGKHPVILILDDLQWIDDSSADLLARLLHLVEHKAILLLCAVRRDRHTAGWRLKEAAERNLPHRLVEIALYPLTDTDSRQLLDGLLGESEFPAELRSLILDKAEGNPLFVEEVVHHLIEHGYLVREGKGLPWKTTGLVDSIQLPDSLQALLTARIDRLDEATRRTVQIAAVIGRFFPRSPLAALVEQPELLDQQLLELQRMELIRETTRVPEPGYTFYHALTHEATYNTILLKQRRIMHRQVAETIETLREDNLSVVAPVLAHHFAEGDAPERALPYLIMAADSALQLHATAEAIAFYNRALPMAIDFDEPPERVTHIYLSRGRALELQSRFKDADQTYQELEQRGLDCDDQGMVLQSIIAQGKLRSNVTPFFDADDARELMDRALKLAQELGDRPAEVRILWNMVNIDRFDLNSIHNAIERGERALEMARELGLIEEEAYLLNDLTDVFGTVGRIEEAKQLAKKAHERWRALGNEPMLADSLSNACMIAFMSGEMDRALALADEAYRITSRIDNPWGQGFSQGLRGVVYIYLGQLGRAMEDLPAALIKSIEANFMGGQVVIHSSLAHLYQEVGLMQLAKEHAEKGIRIGREFIPQFVGLSLARLILIKLALGQVDAAAEIWADNAELAESRNNIIANDIVVAQIELALAMGEHERLQDILQTTETNFIQNGIWGFLPDIWQGYTKVLLVKGEVDEARDKITEAIALARKIGLRLNLWHYLLTKLEIEQRVDNQEGVIALKSEIREEIEYIAGNIFEDDMRRNFLAQPSIQELVQKDVLTL